MPVLKYIKKPVTVEAIKWNGSNGAEVLGFINGETNNRTGFFLDYVLYIKTPEGIKDADVGDMIIKGINGEFCLCKPDIFIHGYNQVT